MRTFIRMGVRTRAWWAADLVRRRDGYGVTAYTVAKWMRCTPNTARVALDYAVRAGWLTVEIVPHRANTQKHMFFTEGGEKRPPDEANLRELLKRAYRRYNQRVGVPFWNKRCESAIDGGIPF